jgi:hypothetical protein
LSRRLSASEEPIRHLIDIGCDFEAELPRPLRSWGAQWLVREILAAREQRLRFADSVKGFAALALTYRRPADQRAGTLHRAPRPGRRGDTETSRRSRAARMRPQNALRGPERHRDDIPR